MFLACGAALHADTGEVIVDAGHQHGASRRAGEACIEVCQQHALTGQPIDIRRGNLGTEDTEIAEAEVVGDDQQDVRSPSGRDGVCRRVSVGAGLASNG